MNTAANHRDIGPAREEIKQRIQAEDGYCVGCLLRLYSYQTADEQRDLTTKYDNGEGFNGTDGYVLSDMSKFYLERGYLTEKQINFIRTKIVKYTGQLEGQIIEPLSIKRPTKRTRNDRPAEYKTAELKGDTITLKFGFPKGDKRFFDCVSQVKTLAGRRFDKSLPGWTAPLGDDTVELLGQWGFTFDANLKKWVASQEIGTLDSDLDIPGIKLQPYPFQRQGVAFLENHGGRALIGDEMGLGKTGQALMWLQLHPEIRPALVVVPANLKVNWAREVDKWMTFGTRTAVVSGRKPKKLTKASFKNKTPDEAARITRNHEKAMTKYNRTADAARNADIIIVNYDILKDWVPVLRKLRLKSVIIDECQMIKNSAQKTQRTKAVFDIVEGVPSVIGLSGTPIENRPIEFYNIISLIRPTLFPSRMKYGTRFCGATHNGFGWDFGGATNKDELHEIVQRIMIRRKKAEVLPELPEKVRTVIPLEIKNRAKYDRVKDEVYAALLGKLTEEQTKARKEGRRAKDPMKARAMVEYEKLKQAAVEGKMDDAVDWIRNFLDQDEKLVVFAVHKATVERLEKEFGEIAVSTAHSSTPAARQAAVDAFQGDPAIRLFIGQVRRDGSGITLHAASSTATLELDWNPMKHAQAEDRVHRIGQEADSVNAYYLLAANTVEEDIAELLDKKLQNITAIMDGEEVEDYELVGALLDAARLDLAA